MFKDKAKEKFEVYFYLSSEASWEHDMNDFEKLPLSMKWGVIEDFAESEGYIIEFIYRKHFKHWEFWINENETTDKEFIEFKTRTEARLECIKKLNDLLNKEI